MGQPKGKKGRTKNHPAVGLVLGVAPGEETPPGAPAGRVDMIAAFVGSHSEIASAVADDVERAWQQARGDVARYHELVEGPRAMLVALVELDRTGEEAPKRLAEIEGALDAYLVEIERRTEAVHTLG